MNENEMEDNVICQILDCKSPGRKYLNYKCPDHYSNMNCPNCKGNTNKCELCALVCPNCLNKHWNLYYGGLCNICDIWKIVDRKDMLKKRRSRSCNDNDDNDDLESILPEIKGSISQDDTGRIVFNLYIENRKKN